MKLSRWSVLVALGLAACAEPMSDVIVQNRSMHPIHDVSVQVGGHELSAGALAPGRLTAVVYRPKTESSIAVSFRVGQDPTPRSCSVDVYVTSGLEAHFWLVIDEQGCRFRERRTEHLDWMELRADGRVVQPPAPAR